MHTKITISRKGRLIASFLGMALLVAISSRADAPAPPNRLPNIVFILIDDLGVADLGCTGSTYYETPNIDKLASQGMLFTDAYAAAPTCAPSRASLLTGMYSPRTGVLTVGASNRGPIKEQKLIPPKSSEHLDPNWKTIANALDSVGYVTASIGKWHDGTDPVDGPVAHGFSLNIAGSSAGHPLHGYFSPYNLPCLTDGPKGEYLTDRLTDESIKFIEDNKDHPFFLYLPHYAVHTPLEAKPELVAHFANKPGSQGQSNPKYAAMIASVDESVRRIMAKLDELKLADNTLVIFTSDNGGLLPITSNEPFRGGKGMLYEGGTRIPLIVRWPGHVVPGSVCHVPTINIDYMPTFAEITGAKLPDTQPVDGVSIVPLLEGKDKLDRDALYWHYPVYLPGDGIRPGLRWTPAGSIRQGDSLLIQFFEDDHLEEYNLTDDKGETNDLAKTDPSDAEKLKLRLQEWQKSVNAPMPLGPNPKYDPNWSPKDSPDAGKKGGEPGFGD